MSTGGRRGGSQSKTASYPTKIRTAGLATMITLSLLRTPCSDLVCIIHMLTNSCSQTLSPAFQHTPHFPPTSFRFPPTSLPLPSRFPFRVLPPPPACARYYLLIIFMYQVFFPPSVPALRLTLRVHDCVPRDHDSIQTLNALIHDSQV